MLNHAGIYRIHCKSNNKNYIGSTVNLRKRKNQHFIKLKKGTHYNSILQNAYNKYGKDNFEFHIEELITDKEILIIKESEYIKKYNSFIAENGYNIEDPIHLELRAKEYIIRFPGSYDDITVKNLREFCEQNGIDEGSMYATSRCDYDDAGGFHCRYPNMTYYEWLVLRYNKRKKKWIWWIVTSPIGDDYLTRNLMQFCLKYNITHTRMQEVANCHHLNHKGWLCRKTSDTQEEWQEKYNKYKATKLPTGGQPKTSYIITTPEKQEVVVENLNQYCIEKDIPSLYQVAKGLRDSAYHCRFSDQSMEQWQELRNSKKTGPGKGAHRIKSYIIIFPDGHEEEITNINQFCIKNNLSRLYDVAKGNRSIHKGFHCRFSDQSMEQWQQMYDEKHQI